MYSKAALSLAVLAVARLALAQPYCLIAALNEFPHPADQKTLCCAKAVEVENKIHSDICPSSMQADALAAFKTACKEADFEIGSCKKSSSKSSESASKTGSTSESSTSAPYPVVYKTTYFDEECTCSKTKTVSSSAIAGSTGFATGTAAVATGTSAPSASAGSGSGSSATGSPISPANPSKTGTGSGSSTSPASFKGAATKNVGSVAAGLLAVAGIAVAL